jgi:hypothetical protein
MPTMTIYVVIIIICRNKNLRRCPHLLLRLMLIFLNGVWCTYQESWFDNIEVKPKQRFSSNFDERKGGDKAQFQIEYFHSVMINIFC